MNVLFGKDLAGEEFIRICQIVLDDGCPHLLVMQTAIKSTILMIIQVSKRCCGAGERGALIKLPPGARPML
jgi:hypothetical protein